MSVRRVVTGDLDGRSTIVSDGQPVESGLWEDLWIAEPGLPLGQDPGLSESLEAPAGASRWRLFSVPPDDELRAMITEHLGEAASAADIDAVFFHKTESIDYVYVLDGGDITLELEAGEVLLHPGDCVVQRATTHAWHNHNDGPVRLLVVMTTLPSEG